jgi:predicted ATPase/class 3 adenylate cyclase
VNTRNDLPAGTVTLLFTDVEGSTNLLHALGDHYADILGAHRRILRDAFRGHGGIEVDTQGDAFFYAFPDAVAGVMAAAAAQRALAGHAWPAGHPLRVRMGLHTGEPIRTDDGYVGIDLHQGARLMAAAAGGQAIVSEATARVLAGRGLPGLSLADLGEHRFKDFGLPQRVFQIAGEGLETEFPPLRTLSARFANIPTLAGALIGRDDEIAALVGLLVGEGERLVTLTGPGGTGKTSIALRAGAELLEHMQAGVVFCDLSPVTDPALLAPAIARALGLRETGGVSTLDVVTAFLGEKQLLLILDNLEQLLDGVAIVSRLLDACPRIAVLATSRAPLRLAGEREQPVDPLTVADALELLVILARRATTEFSLEGDRRDQAMALCLRLDNLPLAIELAAARLRLFELPELLARLDTRLALLTGGRRDAPERQQTLRATLDWSYELLGDTERRTLARVAVFAGGFTMEAAEDVCGASFDEIGVLVEQNLVRRQGNRLTLLETIREYGLERLAESGEERVLRDRHAEWFTALSEHASVQLYGPSMVSWLDRLELELDNLRGAIAFLLEAGLGDRALRITSPIVIFWEARRAAEGRRALDATLAHRSGADPALLARGLVAAGHLTFFAGDMSSARAYFEEAVGITRGFGDPTWLALSLARLSWVAMETELPDEQFELASEALTLLDGITEPWARAETLNFVGTAIANGHERSRGVALLEQSRAAYLAMGNEQRAAEVLNNLGWAAMLDGDFDAARDFHLRNLEVARSIRDGFRLTLALGNLGLIAALTGKLDEARPLTFENLTVLRDRGERRNIGEALVVAAACAAHRANGRDAARLAGASEAIYGLGGVLWNDFERRIIDAYVFPAVGPGGESLAGAREEGKSLTVHEAIALALEVLDDG